MTVETKVVTHNVGTAKLARETGRNTPQIAEMLRRGMTEQEIRAYLAELDRKRAAGLPVKGRAPKGKGTGMGGPRPEPEGYVPTRRQGGMRERSGEAYVPPVPGPLPPRPVRTDPPPVAHTNGYTDGRDNGHTNGRSEGRLSGGGESIVQATLRKEIALADLRELELAQKKGELVELEQVNLFVGGRIIKARDTLMRMGPELRDRLAACQDPVECERLVEKSVRAALESLALVPKAE